MKAANNALKGNRFAAAASKVAVVCGNTVPDGKMGFLVAAAWRYCRIIPAGKASGGQMTHHHALFLLGCARSLSFITQRV